MPTPTSKYNPNNTSFGSSLNAGSLSAGRGLGLGLTRKKKKFTTTTTTKTTTPFSGSVIVGFAECGSETQFIGKSILYFGGIL